MKRIARGLNKFVLNTADPYIVRIDQTSYGKVKRTNSIVDHHSLVQVKMHNGDINRELEVQLFLEEYCKSSESISNQEVAFLTKYYGSDIGQHLNEPLHTIPTKDRFGLVKVKGSAYRIVDITMRMLQPHELAKHKVSQTRMY